MATVVINVDALVEVDDNDEYFLPGDVAHELTDGLDVRFDTANGFINDYGACALEFTGPRADLLMVIDRVIGVDNTSEEAIDLRAELITAIRGDN